MHGEPDSTEQQYQEKQEYNKHNSVVPTLKHRCRLGCCHLVLHASDQYGEVVALLCAVVERVEVIEDFACR
jgi:hypothetical protein